MKIRLMGTQKECDEIVGLFEELNMLDVLEVSRSYANSRGNTKSSYVRVYIDVSLRCEVGTSARAKIKSEDTSSV